VSIKRSEKRKAKAKVDWVDVTSDEEKEEEKEEEEEEAELQNEQNEQGHGKEKDNNDEMMARRTMAETKGSLWSSSMGHCRANGKKSSIHSTNHKSCSCRAFYHFSSETCLKGKQSPKASAIPGTFN
jgi:hypothetical protein